MDDLKVPSFKIGENPEEMVGILIMCVDGRHHHTNARLHFCAQTGCLRKNTFTDLGVGGNFTESVPRTIETAHLAKGRLDFIAMMRHSDCAGKRHGTKLLKLPEAAGAIQRVCADRGLNPVLLVAKTRDVGDPDLDPDNWTTFVDGLGFYQPSVQAAPVHGREVVLRA